MLCLVKSCYVLVAILGGVVSIVVLSPSPDLSGFSVFEATAFLLFFSEVNQF